MTHTGRLRTILASILLTVLGFGLFAAFTWDARDTIVLVPATTNETVEVYLRVSEKDLDRLHEIIHPSWQLGWHNCEEDEPCWDCNSMGNKICGPTKEN